MTVYAKREWRYHSRSATSRRGQAPAGSAQDSTTALVVVTVASSASVLSKVGGSGFEVDPPHGLGARKAIEGTKLLKESGVDVINVGDSPTAPTLSNP